MPCGAIKRSAPDAERESPASCSPTASWCRASTSTDLGTLAVQETLGRAPSHVALHEPRGGLLISGDHLLGRSALYFDYGHTPDPVGEFLRSLDVVERLDAKLCVAGHGRPFRDVQAHIDGTGARSRFRSVVCATRSRADRRRRSSSCARCWSSRRTKS